MNDAPANDQVIFPSRIFFSLLFIAFATFLVLTKIGCFKQAPDVTAANIATESTRPEFSPKDFIALDDYYNAGLKTNWLGGEIRDRSLADVPTNVNVFNGSTFRVGGLIQLQGVTLRKRAPWYPDEVKGIPVQMTCSNLHFFQGTAWSVAEGTQIGTYVIHFADGDRSELPIIYGADVRNWSFDEKDPDQTLNTAWSSKRRMVYFRLFASTWKNPKPDIKVTSFDFISLGTDCAPFLLAVTAE